MLHDYEVDLTGVGNTTIIVCMYIVFLVIWWAYSLWPGVRLSLWFALLCSTPNIQYCCVQNHCLIWLRGTVVERRSLSGELLLSCARPAADGW